MGMSVLNLARNDNLRLLCAVDYGVTINLSFIMNNLILVHIIIICRKGVNR